MNNTCDKDEIMSGANAPSPQQISVSSQAKALIKNMLMVDGERRPSALDLVFGSPWLQSHIKPQELEALS